jgi:hypothetical protein
VEPNSFSPLAQVSYVFGQPTYLFGKPLHPERCSFNSTEGAFASFIGGLWTNLARSGTPADEWPMYGASDKDVNGLLRTPSLSTERGWRADFCPAFPLA